MIGSIIGDIVGSVYEFTPNNIKTKEFEFFNPNGSYTDDSIWGQGEGLQGQSYAIPTMEGIAEMSEAIRRFTSFAAEHPELRFLVSQVIQPVRSLPYSRSAFHWRMSLYLLTSGRFSDLKCNIQR